MKLTFRIWLMLIVLVLSLISIFGLVPTFFAKGVVVQEVAENTPAFDSGLTAGEIITSINGNKVGNFEDYTNTISSIFNEQNDTIKVVVQTKKSTFVFFTNEVPQIVVQDIPKTRIQLGLDLQGGARALVEPETPLTPSEMDDLISVTSERLNVYGLRDVNIRSVKDLSGNNFMLIEIAGASPRELESLIGEQGKFEAKIGDEVVFTGEDKDIVNVCRNDATCSRIERCQTTDSGDFCNYAFSIQISEAAAERHAEITKNLGINVSNPEYLDKKIDFYVDGVLSTSLFISKNLQGRETTDIQISGSSSGQDRTSAIKNTELEMKKMQTILITGSLPYKLNIQKLDTISPVLGQKFNSLIFVTALIALVVVASIIFVRYRDMKASFALLFTAFSEIVIILGIAAAIKWNLDLPSIAGILIAIGTGVDQQIVILDESKSKKLESLKQKLKNALFIVVSAYFTTAFALLPLWWAGAGLLRGFMVTTLIGLSVGVLITRPAFADMVSLLNKDAA